MTRSIYRDCTPVGSFLHEYLRYNEPLETPQSYDFWCGMWLLSMAVGRSLKVNRPHAPVYLNVYAILCSDAGVTRKSTAVRRAEEMYRDAGLVQLHHTVTSNTTPEKLFRDIALQAQNTGVGSVGIIVSELITLLGREQHSMGMPGQLTDLYDCPAVRTSDRVTTGSTVARNVFVSLLAASTPTWLVRAINPDVIEGGFTSRCLFIIEERRKRRVAWPEDTDDSSRRECIAKLTEVRERAAALSATGINLTAAAKVRFTAWYEGRNASGTTPFLHSFEAREDHHVLRLAALLAVNDGRFEVQPHHVDHAIKIVAHHRDSAAALFGEGRMARAMVHAMDALRTLLAEAGVAGLNKSAVIFKMRSHRLSAAELDYALNIMHELDMVQRFELPTVRGRPPVVWRATANIMKRDIVLRANERISE